MRRSEEEDISAEKGLAVWLMRPCYLCTDSLSTTLSFNGGGPDHSCRVSSIAGLGGGSHVDLFAAEAGGASRQGGALLPGETPRMLRGSLVALAAASGATAVRTNATVGCKVTLDGAKAAQW
jgi:hypothetical protein